MRFVTDTAVDRSARRDAAVCTEITNSHARTFSLAGRLLPAEKRRAANALYAFCRIADDLVDQDQHKSAETLALQLAEYRERLNKTLSGSPEGPVFRELARAISRYSIEPEPLHELLDGVERDLAQRTWANWAELRQYCEGVASSVGEMCVHVFGLERSDTGSRATAIRCARTLGLAMQLTNILRDVGEDAGRGRCYLAQDELALHGLTPDDVLRHSASLPGNPAWKAFMGSQVDRARALYAEATPGIRLLENDAQRCALACAEGYAGILTAIEEQDYDSITRRARIGRGARARLLWRAWRAWEKPAVLLAR